MSFLRALERRCFPINKDEVFEYLTKMPHALEEFLITIASENYLEELFSKLRNVKILDLIIRRKSMHTSSTTIFTESEMLEMTRQILACSTDEQIYTKIFDIAQVISCAIDAPDIQLYTVSESAAPLLSTFEPFVPDETGTTAATQVVLDQTPSHIANVQIDTRFSNDIGFDTLKKCHTLSVPLILESGHVYCVVQFLRPDSCAPFSKYEFEFTSTLLSWIMASVQKLKHNRVNRIKTELHNFLLDSTRILFEDMENIDALIMNIMTFTKELGHADRCSLFLVDQQRKELYADYFDEGLKDDNGQSLYSHTAQIRFSISCGIAGFVAKTGQIVNIKDAYKDDRFNIEVDKKTGYVTRNILCMPILGKNCVLGVVQLINRLDGEFFSDEDEESFQTFAVYCALALNYSHIFSIINQQKVQQKIAMELLNFHISCPEEECMKLVENPYLQQNQVPSNFFDYIFCCYDYDNILPQLCILMIQDTFGIDAFPLDKLCRFTLTVRKNYRPVLYHNWHHGFHVMHALWCMLRTSTEKFTRLEKIAVIIGGLCHDIDHRGYNNEFFKKLKHPLAALYTTSVMEQHHYKQTITILHADGHDIFSMMSPQDYKEVLELIRINILGTDLALYFPNAKLLNGLLEKKEFNIANPQHREGLFSIMMTGADLCAITKPWSSQKKTVELIYEEFYMQGDIEKKAGLQPIPMMDRLNKGDIPKQQLGFIGFICKPMYTTLQALMPETKPLLDGCLVNKVHWEEVIAESAAKKKATEDNGATKTDGAENKAKLETLKTENANVAAKKENATKETTNTSKKEADANKEANTKETEPGGSDVNTDADTEKEGKSLETKKERKSLETKGEVDGKPADVAGNAGKKDPRAADVVVSYK